MFDVTKSSTFIVEEIHICLLQVTDGYSNPLLHEAVLIENFLLKIKAGKLLRNTATNYGSVMRDVAQHYMNHNQCTFTNKSMCTLRQQIQCHVVISTSYFVNMLYRSSQLKHCR